MNNEMNYVDEGKRKKTLSHYVILLILALVMVYAVYLWVSQSAKAEELQKSNEELKAQITLTQQQCDEYSRILSSDDQSEYMERIAIEKYGYGYPGEKRYYFTSKE